MPDNTLVQPISAQQVPQASTPPQGPTQAPPTSPTPQSSTPEAPPKFPSVLAKMPTMQALMAGDPPAVSFTRSFDKRDEAKLLVQHKNILARAGFGFYKSLSGQIGVLFNQLHIHPQDLQAADKSGKLLQIAPPWDVVDRAISKAGIHNPVLKSTGVPNAFAAPRLQPPPQASAALPPGVMPSPIKQAPAGVQRGLMRARLQSVQPGAPTSGPEPGAGRILNQILKPVV